MAPNIYNVEKMVKAALDGIYDADVDINADDVVSAVFTLTRRIIAAVMTVNPATAPELRQGVQTLLMECADGGKPN